ncbi:trypsin, putative [Vibrio metschnikovii]|uniref:serine protease n=1 Tax=Vibrio metschnikovii TaxID=28172 RepID=UPI0005939B95|nr:trypsin-like serine protease [Vibrio metschnikovii]SUP09405.1 trypsin, putative [Vibrio metschnikovii]SUP50432.1 trypsin, putative [Vibrio metschnikovii]
MKHNILSAAIGTLLLSSSPLMASGTDSDITARIIGGEKAQPNDWPYMAALTRINKNTSFCGGSLISERYVLTAAHCVVGKAPSDFEALLSAYDMEQLSSATRVKVNQIYLHADYQKNSSSSPHDIAVLELVKAVTIEAAELDDQADVDSLIYGSDMTTLGFGYRQHNGKQGYDKPTVLHQVTLPFVPMAQCKQAHSIFEKLGDGVFCAGETGKDTCQGDSGGPIFSNDNSGKKLAGIVSWGVGCGKNPGVYTKVSHYHHWIQDHIKGLSYRQHKDLGIVRIGIDSQAFTFTNQSNNDIELKNPKVLVDGRNGLGDISINNCPESLAAGAKCSIIANYALLTHRQGRVVLELESSSFAEGKISAWLDYDALQDAGQEVANYLRALPEHKAHTNSHKWLVDGDYLRSESGLSKNQNSELVLENLRRGELSFIYSINSDDKLDSLTIYVNGKRKETFYNQATGYHTLELYNAHNTVRFDYNRWKYSKGHDSYVKLSDIKHQKLTSDLINEILIEQAKNSGGGGGSIGFGAGLGLLALMWMRRSRQQ